MRQLIVILISLALLGTLVPKAVAQSDDAQEKLFQVKAAFVFNFLNFSELPNKDADITVCTFSNEVAQKAFSALESKRAKERKIVVRHLSSDDSAENCDIAYIDFENEANTSPNKAAFEKTLTIGESRAFCDNGGIIGFFEDSGKLRFRINLKHARSKGITFSSKLLKLAEVIR